LVEAGRRRWVGRLVSMELGWGAGLGSWVGSRAGVGMDRSHWVVKMGVWES
jgi:hypothetical protein